MSPDEPMDHGAAHERIEDLLVEPARLAAFRTSSAPEDVALREHLAGCPACAGDLEAWRRLQHAVGAALPADRDAARAAVEPIEVPPSLSARVLAAVRASGEPGAPISIARGSAAGGTAAGGPGAGGAATGTPRTRRLAAWLGLAAGIAVLAGAGIFSLDQLDRRAAAETEARELAAALAIVDRMLATDHRVVQLRTTAGLPAGTISWSRHDWVVLTTALAAPPAGQEYLCWLETDGRSVPVGHMDFAGGTAYWVASIDEWQTWELAESTRFVVTLEPAGATIRTGAAVLAAPLDS